MTKSVSPREARRKLYEQNTPLTISEQRQFKHGLINFLRCGIEGYNADDLLSTSQANVQPVIQTEGGFRRLGPYWHNYMVYAKQAWFGRTALDVFSSEFKYRTREYYVRSTPLGPCVSLTNICESVETRPDGWLNHCERRGCWSRSYNVI